MQSQQTFAARAGRWSAKNRKKAIWGWLAFVVIAFVGGNMLGVKKPTNQNEYVGQSGRGDKLADQHFPKQGSENILIQARAGGHATDASVRKAVADVTANVSGKSLVADVKSPYTPGNKSQVSKDGRSVLVTFNVKGEDAAREKAIDPIEAAVNSAGRANPSVTVGQFGDASANKALTKSFHDDFKKAETLSLPITLIILVFAFGAGRRGHPAAAGPDGRRGDPRPDRDPQPDRPDGRHDQLDRAPDRARRRRRLHALLPAP